MDDSTGAFIAALRANAAQWQADGSPFYATLTRRIADDFEAGGPTWTVLSSHTNRPATELPAVRMLDAVHRIVLAGRAPALTPHYPSTGGDGDAVAAWPLFCDVVTRNADELRLALDHPPQTNAVGRCAAGPAHPPLARSPVVARCPAGPRCRAGRIASSSRRAGSRGALGRPSISGPSGGCAGGGR